VVAIQGVVEEAMKILAGIAFLLGLLAYGCRWLDKAVGFEVFYVNHPPVGVERTDRRVMTELVVRFF
jgi:hypothetical protein